jgi:hypothetical protein
METVKSCNVDRHTSAFDLYERSAGHMGGIINPPGVTSTKQYSTLFNHADPLKAAIGRCHQATMHTCKSSLTFATLPSHLHLIESFAALAWTHTETASQGQGSGGGGERLRCFLDQEQARGQWDR